MWVGLRNETWKEGICGKWQVIINNKLSDLSLKELGVYGMVFSGIHSLWVVKCIVQIGIEGAYTFNGCPGGVDCELHFEGARVSQTSWVPDLLSEVSTEGTSDGCGMWSGSRSPAGSLRGVQVWVKIAQVLNVFLDITNGHQKALHISCDVRWMPGCPELSKPILICVVWNQWYILKWGWAFGWGRLSHDIQTIGFYDKGGGQDGL